MRRGILLQLLILGALAMTAACVDDPTFIQVDDQVEESASVSETDGAAPAPKPPKPERPKRDDDDDD